MPYQWGDFTLDRKACLLTRGGQRIDTSRRILDCIGHLIEHQDRIVGYDELILTIWGHRDVSNHQLSQVILNARRTIGDDGQAQHSIRTMPGVGYRWVAATRSSEPHAEAARSPRTSSTREQTPPAPHTTATQVSSVRPHAAMPPKRRLMTAATFSLCLIITAVGPAPIQIPPAGDAAESALPFEDPIGSLRQALLMGRFEEVRDGIATLPPDIRDGIEARLIEIELDIRRGRYESAAEKLAIQTSRAEAAGDPMWRARLLLQKSEIENRLQSSGTAILAPAQSALELLESSGDGVPPEILADALWRRAIAYTMNDRFEEAQRDLVRARDLYRSIGDEHRGAEVRGSLARIRMRTGDLSDALDEMAAVADEYARYGDKVREIFARNTMTKIQIELLRWDDALVSNDRSMALLGKVLESERRYPTLQLRALVLTGQGRLREAASLLEDAESQRSERRDYIIPALFHLEAGNPAAALGAATREFSSSRIDTSSNLLLENRDGAALLWVASAQALVDAGGDIPVPPREMTQLLDNPKTATARCARGRWLLVQGRRDDAETELRQAMAEFDTQNQLYRMILSAEPLIDLLLQRGEPSSARDVLIALRAHDPERVDKDFRVSTLQLKVSLAERDDTAVEMAYRSVVVSGRERRPPTGLLSAYRKYGVDHPVAE
ncbi:MAG: winged helix-turn-helix domain-containing protein [Pseudomonadota bacterium]